LVVKERYLCPFLVNMVSCSNEFPRVPYTSGGTRESGPPRNVKMTTMLPVWEEQVGIRHAQQPRRTRRRRSRRQKANGCRRTSWQPISRTCFLPFSPAHAASVTWEGPRELSDTINEETKKQTREDAYQFRHIPMPETLCNWVIPPPPPPPPRPTHLTCLPNKFRVRKKCTSRLVSCVPHPLPPFCEVLNLLLHVIWWKFTKRNWNLESSKQERVSLLAEGVWK
jgi:hypothetical protein